VLWDHLQGLLVKVHVSSAMLASLLQAVSTLYVISAHLDHIPEYVVVLSVLFVELVSMRPGLQCHFA
jgi:hypothetical protein